MCITVGAKSSCKPERKRLSGNTQREATSDKVGDFRKENNQLKHVLADMVLKSTV